MKRSKLLLDISSSENVNMISSEGCFACDMNKVNRNSNGRVTRSRNGANRSSRKNRQSKNGINIHGRKQRSKRNHQILSSNTKPKFVTDTSSARKDRRKRRSDWHFRRQRIIANNVKPYGNLSAEIEDAVTNSFDTRSMKLFKGTKWGQFSTSRLDTTVPNVTLFSHKHPVKRLSITLSREQTRKNR